MNDIFSIKRFGQYLATDIKNSAHNCGLSLIILGCSGLLINIIVGFICLVFDGTWAMPELTARVIIFFIMLLCATITLPIKCYGYVTDAKRGPAFTLVPASVLEKSISMILVAGVLVPMLTVIIYCGLDALTVTLFPSMGDSLFSSKSLLMDKIMTSMESENEAGMVNFAEYSKQFESFINYFLGYGWQAIKFITTALTFLLGAIVFKRQKGAKTILAIAVLSIATSLIFTPALMADPEAMMDATPEAVAHTFKQLSFMVKAISIALPVLLCGGIFYRIKTIKH